jgi:hypothetical protein
MANRNYTNTSGDLAMNAEQSNPTKLLSLPNPKSSERNDDLIGSLAERYENQRARQVGEWERLYSHNVYRAV